MLKDQERAAPTSELLLEDFGISHEDSDEDIEQELALTNAYRGIPPISTQDFGVILEKTKDTRNMKVIAVSVVIDVI